ARDELDALTHDFRQNGFAISINGGHLDQLNDALPRVPYVARFSPTRLELRRPRADHPTLQRPPLLIGQFGHSNLQHCSPSIACQKPLPSEAFARICRSCYGAVTVRERSAATLFQQPASAL